MNNDIETVFYPEETIKARVKELGGELSREYAEKNPIIIGVLKGSFIFMSDLVRAMDIPCAVEFLSASSYGNDTVSSGDIKLKINLGTSLEGRHVLIVEDILDTGSTLSVLKEHLQSLGPASLKLAVFLDKRERRLVPISADFVGFECPDEFYVGYGLDYAEKYRNLPYIGSLKASLYS